MGPKKIVVKGREWCACCMPGARRVLSAIPYASGGKLSVRAITLGGEIRLEPVNVVHAIGDVGMPHKHLE